ncbi:MAG: MFS transporter, partial [Candidatus Acidiferrum sp.]
MRRMMKAGGWPSIVTTYLFGVFAIVTMVRLIPLQLDIAQKTGATAAQFGLLIGLAGLPAAVLATVSGAVVDRFGPRTVLIGGALGITITSIAAALASSYLQFAILRLLEGVALVGLFTAGPVLLMRTTSGRRQAVAMTFWSTMSPVGVALGFETGGAFARTPLWYVAFLISGAALFALAAVALCLPEGGASSRPAPTLREQGTQLLQGYKQSGPLRLAFVYVLSGSTALGIDTVITSYIANTHRISVSSAAELTAGAALVMIGGALLVGAVLGRGYSPFRLCAPIALAASIFGSLIFVPACPLLLVGAALCGWFFALGAAMALIFAIIPRVA